MTSLYLDQTFKTNKEDGLFETKLIANAPVTCVYGDERNFVNIFIPGSISLLIVIYICSERFDPPLMKGSLLLLSVHDVVDPVLLGLQDEFLWFQILFLQSEGFYIE